jgi:hypothetical protein
VNAQPVGFGSPLHLGSNHVCVLRKRKDGFLYMQARLADNKHKEKGVLLA